MRARDTSRAAERAQSYALGRMSGARRVELAARMSEDARELTRSGIRARHPSYASWQVEQALRRLLLGDELVQKAWPTLPLVEP